MIRLALERFGISRTETLLNGFDPTLEGRPIAIAAGSMEGAAAVEKIIAFGTATLARVDIVNDGLEEPNENPDRGRS